MQLLKNNIKCEQLVLLVVPQWLELNLIALKYV